LIGFYHFYDFLTSTDIKRIVFNTFNISLTGLIAGFPAPIILALLLNEIRSRTWKRTVQTISYMPHFISVVVICGMIRSFVSDTGIVTWLLHIVGLSDKIDLLGKKDLFVPIYVTSGIWQEIGWGSIIYLAALTGISQELYEAAEIDGAGRWRQLLAVTLPGIIPTIVILLILRMGSIMSVGFEKIILLYNPLTYETADVISSYTYRRGLMEFNYSYSTAVGLLNSLINFVLLISANTISKKVNNTSMW
jgi:putative aldouronate transport system permease protein